MKIKFEQLKKKAEATNLTCPLILLHGTNNLEISKSSKELAFLISGSNAEKELRLTEVSWNSLSKEPNLLFEKLKAVGFFPGPQVLIVTEATDSFTIILKEAMTNWKTGDTYLIVTANALNSRSSLKKFIEEDQNYFSVPLYNVVSTGDELKSLLEKSNLKFSDENFVETLQDQLTSHTYEYFYDLLTKLSLYKFNDPTPVTKEEIEKIAFDHDNANENEILNLLAEGSTVKMVLLLNRLKGQGKNPTQLLILARNHMLLLHKISLKKTSFEIILRTIFPPIFGNRREQLRHQSKIWSTQKIESALQLIRNADLRNRQSRIVSDFNILERAFIRISYLVKN